MNKWVVISAIILALLCLAEWQRERAEALKRKYEIAQQNILAYQDRNSDLQQKNRVFQLTIKELENSVDSLDQRIVKVIDSLKVKPKNIEHVHYVETQIHKIDTINFVDTIFVNNLHLDTLIGDKWYQANLELDYPSRITLNPQFNSEMYVILDKKKEYVNKPSKIFFIRWFQKRRWIAEIQVVEKNPYIDIKQQKFIKIIK